MRSTTLLSSVLLGAAVVHAAPRSSCVCSSLATTTTTSTTTIFDKTVNVKSTTTIPTTLDGTTKTQKLISTVEVDYTTLVTRPSTVITTITVAPSSLAPRNSERDVDVLNEAKAQCDCTTTVTKVKTAHGKVTETAVVTKVDKIPGSQVTYTSVRTKTVSSVVDTDVAYSPVYSTFYVTIPASSSTQSVTSKKSSSSKVASNSKSKGSPTSKTSSSTSTVTSSTTKSSSSSGLVTSSTPLITTTSQSTSSSIVITSSPSSSTTSTISPPKPTITSGFGSCSTIPSEFLVEVQGLGFASIEFDRKSPYAYVVAVNSSTSFFIDSSTSALSYIQVNPYNSAYNLQYYTCSNIQGGYEQEAIFLAPKNTRCIRGFAKFTLADDCSFTVSDNIGGLQPTVDTYDGSLLFIPFEDLESYSRVATYEDVVMIAQPVNAITSASSTSTSSTITTSSTSSNISFTTTSIITSSTSSLTTSSATSNTSASATSAAPVCSTPPSHFTLQVSGLTNGSISVEFANGPGYGEIVNSTTNATIFTIDPATSALLLRASPGRNIPIMTYLSCSDFSGGYEFEGLSFQQATYSKLCNRGWMKVALAADCVTLSVSDNYGELVALIPANSETVYLVAPSYVDQFNGYMEPANLSISPVA